MMKNKKAWLRILEAFIAIMLISSVLIVLYTKNVQKTKKTAVYEFQKTVLDEIATNDELRNAVLGNKSSVETLLRGFIMPRVPLEFKFDVKVCELEEICNLNEYHENTFASERTISANLTKYYPKKVKIFMWKE